MGHFPVPPAVFLPVLSVPVKKALEKIYDTLAEEQAALAIVCRQCGKCCNFMEYDHQLWATTIEVAYLLDTAGAMPVEQNGICPYLHEHRCTARNGRTLGCRIFLCEMNALEMERLHEKYLTLIQQLAREFELELEYEEFISSLTRHSK